MSSYYDDPDFADEYRRRDEEAVDWAIREKEAEAQSRATLVARRSDGDETKINDERTTR